MWIKKLRQAIVAWVAGKQEGPLHFTGLLNPELVRDRIERLQRNLKLQAEYFEVKQPVKNIESKDDDLYRPYTDARMIDVE